MRWRRPVFLGLSAAFVVAAGDRGARGDAAVCPGRRHRLRADAAGPPSSSGNECRVLPPCSLFTRWCSVP